MLMSCHLVTYVRIYHTSVVGVDRELAIYRAEHHAGDAVAPPRDSCCAPAASRIHGYISQAVVPKAENGNRRVLGELVRRWPCGVERRASIGPHTAIDVVRPLAKSAADALWRLSGREKHGGRHTVVTYEAQFHLASRWLWLRSDSRLS